MADVFATVASLEGQTNVFPPDHRAYVQTFRDWFRMDVSASDTRDGVNILTPGAGSGRWRRLNIADPSWMLQQNWYIDPVSGNDENTGADIAHPIKTDGERDRRWGPLPRAVSGLAYHIYLIGALSSGMNIVAIARGAAVYIHGSSTIGQGSATLFSGTVDSGSVALNTATNTPLQIVSNALPTSWTASALIGARLRFTSGAALGATAIPLLDLGSKKARLTEPLTAQTLTTATYSATRSTATPSNGDTFVVESLPAITGTVTIASNGSGADIIFDSIDLSGATVSGLGSRVSFVNCVAPPLSSHPLLYCNMLGCKYPPGIAPLNGTQQTRYEWGGGIAATAPSDAMPFFGTSGIGVMAHFVFQGNGGRGVYLNGGTPGDGPGWSVTTLGVFDALYHTRVRGFTTLFDAFVIWGSNNGVTLLINAGAAVISTNTITSGEVPATSTTSDVQLGNLTSLRAFDNAVGRHTQPRVLNWANILATIANGGFCEIAGNPRITNPNGGATLAVAV